MNHVYLWRTDLSDNSGKWLFSRKRKSLYRIPISKKIFLEYLKCKTNFICLEEDISLFNISLFKAIICHKALDKRKSF